MKTRGSLKLAVGVLTVSLPLAAVSVVSPSLADPPTPPVTTSEPITRTVTSDKQCVLSSSGSTTTSCTPGTSVVFNGTKVWRPLTRISVGSTGALSTSHKARTLLSFDVANIPANATVIKADLQLTVESVVGIAPSAMYEVSSPSGIWNPPSYTFNPTWNVPWRLTPSPPPYQARASATIANPSPGDIVHFEPTGLVADWITGALPNQGFLIKQSDEATEQLLYFNSSSASTGAPRLVVDYTVPEVPDPCATGAATGSACDVGVQLSDPAVELGSAENMTSDGSATTDVVNSVFNGDGSLDMPATLQKVRTLYSTSPAYSSLSSTQVDSAVESARQALLNAPAAQSAAGWYCNYSYSVNWIRKKRLGFIPYAADVHISAATSCSGIQLVSCSVYSYIALAVPSILTDAGAYSSGSGGCFLNTYSATSARPAPGYLMIQMVGPGRFKLISSRPHYFTIT